MSHKKLYIAFIVVVLIIAGLGAIRLLKVQKQNQTPFVNNQPTSTPSSSQPQPQKLSAANDIGSLMPTATGNAQTYSNNYLGVKLIVPKNWVLGDIYDKNVIIFNGPAAGSQGTESQALQILYYPDFQTWLKNNNTARPSGCTSIKNCFEGDPDYTIKDMTINGVAALSVISSAGESTSNTVLLDHNGIYGFDGYTDAVHYNFSDVINTLQFLK